VLSLARITGRVPRLLPRWALAVGVLAALAFTVNPAMAAVNFSDLTAFRTSWTPYSFKYSNCTTLLDPIQTVMWGPGGTAGVTSNHFVEKTKWKNQSGATQYFRLGGACGPHHWQEATGGTSDNRYHARAGQDPNQDSNGWHTYLTPHYETWDCTDSVGNGGDRHHQVPTDGYRKARDRVYDLFNGSHHKTTMHNWGNQNTRNRWECPDEGGHFVAADGNVVYINMPTTNLHNGVDSTTLQPVDPSTLFRPLTR
jgi:hypothetical protein